MFKKLKFNYLIYYAYKKKKDEFYVSLVNDAYNDLYSRYSNITTQLLNKPYYIKNVNDEYIIKFNFYKTSGLKLLVTKNNLAQIYNNLWWSDYKYDTHERDSLFTSNLSKTCESILISRHQKIKRIDKRITYMRKIGKLYFCTFTFTNDVLDSTEQKTRRTYISRYLKSITKYFIANIDYGDHTNREHYHALISDFKDNIKWEYGFYNIQEVINLDDDVKVIKYLTKLRNHALKKTTNNEKIIYSRN